MKYLKYYKNNSSINTEQVINTLNNLLNTLGLQFNTYDIANSYTVCCLPLDIGNIRKGIISIIINALFDTNDYKYDIAPVLDDFNVNYAIDKELKIIINCNDTDIIGHILTKKIFVKNNQELYKEILNKVIEFFSEKSTRKYKIQATNNFNLKGMDDVINLSYINNLIINYLKLLGSKTFNNIELNFEDLYKMTYNAICESPNNLKIFNNIYKNKIILYNHLKKFGEIELNLAKDMGKTGFR